MGWLRRNEILPPTPEALERMYLEHDAFVEAGIQWDQEQLDLIQQFKDKKTELDEKYEREQLSEPQSWSPNKSELEVITQIDEVEKMYMQEYQKVYAKDKENNKDLNHLALEELKRAHYFFEYVRTSKKLFEMEQSKTAVKS